MEIGIIVLILMILLNGFFAGSEIALISLNDNKIRRDAEAGDKKAQMIFKLTSRPTRFLSTIQIGVTLSGFLASAFAADFFSAPLAEWMAGIGVPLPVSTLQTLSLVVITVVLSYFTLVFGELVPKQLALSKSESFSNVIIGPLTLMFKVAYPFVKLLSMSTNGVVRLFGVNPEAERDDASEEDIKMLVDLGGERGHIRPSEKMMIENVFKFDDIKVTNIATHRTDMSVIDVDASLAETACRVNREKYTRFPVYEEHIDNIIGILHVKDLVELLEADSTCRAEDFDIRNYCRKPFFVMENLKIDAALKTMQQNNIHLAIILDEYGGTEGLITIEDILGTLVGDIQPEHGGGFMESVKIRKISENKYKVTGNIHLIDVEDFIDKALPTGEYDTLNGFLIDQIGGLPKPGEKPEIVYNQLHFKVKKHREKRIDEVLITVMDESDRTV